MGYSALTRDGSFKASLTSAATDIPAVRASPGSSLPPPYDINHFEHDITGPITLMFLVFHETGHVPDSDGTLMLLGMGVAALVGLRWFRTS